MRATKCTRRCPCEGARSDPQSHSASPDIVLKKMEMRARGVLTADTHTYTHQCMSRGGNCPARRSASEAWPLVIKAAWLKFSGYWTWGPGFRTRRMSLLARAGLATFVWQNCCGVVCVHHNGHWRQLFAVSLTTAHIYLSTSCWPWRDGLLKKGLKCRETNAGMGATGTI